MLKVVYSRVPHLLELSWYLHGFVLKCFQNMCSFFILFWEKKKGNLRPWGGSTSRRTVWLFSPLKIKSPTLKLAHISWALPFLPPVARLGWVLWPRHRLMVTASGPAMAAGEIFRRRASTVLWQVEFPAAQTRRPRRSSSSAYPRHRRPCCPWFAAPD